MLIQKMRQKMHRPGWRVPPNEMMSRINGAMGGFDCVSPAAVLQWPAKPGDTGNMPEENDEYPDF